LGIIYAVCQHGALTREQIRHLFFRKAEGLGSVQTACRRLKVLVERGYLHRVRIPTRMGSGPYVYFPGAQAEIALSKDEAMLARGRRRVRIHSATEVAHSLETTNFYVRLNEDLQERGGHIIVWLSERQAHYILPGSSRSLPLTPDAYCLWTLCREEGSFFLEWDRGTESMIRIAEKLARYEVYYRTRAYHDHLGEIGLRPRLLFVVPDERRKGKLTGWVARRLNKGEWASLPTILVATRDEANADPLGSVWRRPDSSGAVRLVD
jgi:hypothetical protein